MTKYLLFIPKGGLNDCFTGIQRMLDYCKKWNRTLLIDMTNSFYHINMAQWFTIQQVTDFPRIIYDTIKIRDIIQAKSSKVYPSFLQERLLDILDGKIKLQYKRGSIFTVEGNELILPQTKKDEDIIFHSQCAGGRGIRFFRQVRLHSFLKDICNQRIKQLPTKYLCIQVRHTDHKCNYEELYHQNQSFIDSYPCIYIATDNLNVITFFKTKHNNVKNFTTFPSQNTNIPLHYEQEKEVDSNTKMIDLVCDIFIAIHSQQILSNSKGGFINLLRDAFQQRDFFYNKLK